MLSNKISRWFLVANLVLGLAGSSYAMSRPPPEPVLMEFVRIVYEKDAGAIITEWIVPNIDAIEGLGRFDLPLFKKTFLSFVRKNRCNRKNPLSVLSSPCDVLALCATILSASIYFRPTPNR